MPILMQLINDRACPIVQCDHCGEHIEDSSEGNVLFDPDELDHGTTIYIVHKQCTRAFETNKSLHWQGLATFLFYIVHNTKTDINKVRKTEKIWQQF